MTQDISPGGIPVEHHTSRSTPPEPAAPGGSLDRMMQHLTRYVGVPEKVYHELESDLVHLDLLIVRPEEGRDYWTIATCGMSDRAMNVPQGSDELRYAELMICLPREWKLPVEQEDWSAAGEEVYWPIQLLKTLARFPHMFDTWLGPGHTVPNGDSPQPYARNTRLCGAFLAEPTIAVEGFKTLEITPEKKIRFYAVIPVYREEMELKLKRGVAELSDRLHEAGVSEILNLRRKNVAKKRFGLF